MDRVVNTEYMYDKEDHKVGICIKIHRFGKEISETRWEPYRTCDNGRAISVIWDDLRDKYPDIMKGLRRPTLDYTWGGLI